MYFHVSLNLHFTLSSLSDIFVFLNSATTILNCFRFKLLAKMSEESGEPCIRKARGKKFSNNQRTLLVRAVNDRKKILFGSFSPSLTSADKDEMWQEVSDW